MSANEEKGGAPRQSLDDWRAKAGIPRRACLDLCTPAELAIYDAVAIVEAAGCDVRLTEAIVLLARARDCVADFVDGVSPGTAAPAALIPSSSTPPAPDLPQETGEPPVNWQAAACALIDRLYAAVPGTAIVDEVSAILRKSREVPRAVSDPATEARADAADHAAEIETRMGHPVTAAVIRKVVAAGRGPRPAAQRPPDPAAPDLPRRIHELEGALRAAAAACMTCRGKGIVGAPCAVVECRKADIASWGHHCTHPAQTRPCPTCGQWRTAIGEGQGIAAQPPSSAALDEKQVGAAPHSPEER